MAIFAVRQTQLHAALLASASLLAFPVAAHAQTGPFVYAPNAANNTVSVIDTANNLVSNVITLGPNPGTPGSFVPGAASVTGDGSLVYVGRIHEPGVPFDATALTPIDTSTNTPGGQIGTGTGSYFSVITPDGKTVYASNLFQGNVTPINTATNTLGTPIAINSANSIVVTPDGKTVYVVSGGNAVTPIDTATNKAGSPIPVGINPSRLAISPDGKTLYVSNFGGNSITPINTATNTAGAPIPIVKPLGIVVSPNGKTLYAVSEVSLVTGLRI